MATHNGEAYIKQQIESILTQSMQDYVLYICDDCSDDATWDIAMRYAQKYPGRIIASRNEYPSGSAKTNFFQMMSVVKDDYVMLCDQDDVWKPDKIEVTLEKMQELETATPDVPILVHTDLTVVDETMRVMFPSYKTYMKSKTGDKPFGRRLIQNAVTGCTVMYNRALARYLLEMPEFMMMHDWWLMLIAAAFGKIGFYPQQTLYYRQHNSNDIGMSYIRSWEYKCHKLRHREEMREALDGTYRQAKSFLQMFSNCIPAEIAPVLRQYGQMPEKTKRGRLATILRLGTYKDSLLRNIALFLFV